MGVFEEPFKTFGQPFEKAGSVYDAKRKLNNKFGKTNILTEAYRSKLEHWPPVKEHDGEALEELVSKENNIN